MRVDACTRLALLLLLVLLVQADLVRPAARQPEAVHSSNCTVSTALSLGPAPPLCRAEEIAGQNGEDAAMQRAHRIVLLRGTSATLRRTS